jgi:hypothetical protein
VDRFQLSVNCICDALILIGVTDVNGILHKLRFRLLKIVSSDEPAKVLPLLSHLAMPPS